MNRQRGVAVITAILVVAVAATAATLMLAQQAAVLDQTMLVASRAQADTYARAGLDWARGTILEDTRSSNAYDALNEPWSKPIIGLPVERALVSGSIADEQAKFNLNNLVGTNNSTSLADMEIFQRLLAEQGLAPQLADAVLDWIDANDVASPAGAEDAYYLSLKNPYRAANRPMMQIEELYRVRGFDAAAVAKLRPFVTALPGHTPVNVNTAPEALIEVVLPDAKKDRVAEFVKARATKPAVSAQAFAQLIGSAAPEDRVGVRSDFFSVIVRVSQDEVELATDALIQRPQQGAPVIIWRRPRY